MKSNRLQKYESKIEPEASPEQIKQAREWMVNQVMEAYDRLPANIQPVSESFEELVRQAKFGVPRQPTHIISGASEKTNEIFDTKINAKVDTGINAKVDTFTETEMEILRKIQNGE
jgi:hypothetical protein